MKQSDEIIEQLQKVSKIAFDYMNAKGVDWSKVETLSSFREGGTDTFLAVVHYPSGDRRRIDQDIGEISLFFTRINEIRFGNKDIKWNGLRIFTFSDERMDVEFITDPDFEENVLDQLWEEVDI